MSVWGAKMGVLGCGNRLIMRPLAATGHLPATAVRWIIVYNCLTLPPEIAGTQVEFTILSHINEKAFDFRPHRCCRFDERLRPEGPRSQGRLQELFQDRCRRYRA